MKLPNRVAISIISVMLVSGFTTSAMSQECDYWFKSVGVKNAPEGVKPSDKMDPTIIMSGIRCLLSLQGDTTRGAFMGATNFEVSAQLPETTVAICALYKISELFFGSYRHANGVALRYTDGREGTNTDAQVEEAYRYYRKWFKDVEEIGLEKARERKLDPLKGSGLRWY